MGRMENAIKGEDRGKDLLLCMLSAERMTA